MTTVIQNPTYGFVQIAIAILLILNIIVWGGVLYLNWTHLERVDVISCDPVKDYNNTGEEGFYSCPEDLKGGGEEWE